MLPNAYYLLQGLNFRPWNRKVGTWQPAKKVKILWIPFRTPLPVGFCLPESNRQKRSFRRWCCKPQWNMGLHNGQKYKRIARVLLLKCGSCLRNFLILTNSKRVPLIEILSKHRAARRKNLLSDYANPNDTKFIRWTSSAMSCLSAALIQDRLAREFSSWSSDPLDIVRNDCWLKNNFHFLKCVLLFVRTSQARESTINTFCLSAGRTAYRTENRSRWVPSGHIKL